MKLLEQTILKKGKVLPGNVIKVGAFLNNQIDVNLLNEMGKDIYAHFSNCGVNKILTVEASGIAIACITAQFFNCPVVFAKKNKTSNVEGEVYTAPCFSYTHMKQNTLVVPSEFLSKGDNVLIIDDLLARGEALNACIGLVEQAGAKVIGCSVAIEKCFQNGGDELRSKGVDVYSLAQIESMDNGNIVFRK